MKYEKFQKKVFDELLKGKKVCWHLMDDDNALVLMRYYGMILPIDTICFNVNLCEKKEELAIFENEKQYGRLYGTDIYAKTAYGIKRKFRSENDGAVWVDEEFLKWLPKGEYDLYAAGRYDAVIAKDKHKNPIGVVMPTIMSEQ